jgi:hypothetical protein
MNYVRLGTLMRHIYIPGLYLKTFCGSRVGGEQCWRNPLLGSSFFLYIREESPGERALVALSPTLESLMLVCTAISPKQTYHPCCLMQAPSHSRLCELAQNRRACCSILPPTFWKIFDIATNPLLLQDRQALVSLPQLCLF